MITTWAIGAVITAVALAVGLRNDWQMLWEETGLGGYVFITLCVVFWFVFWPVVIWETGGEE